MFALRFAPVRLWYIKRLYRQRQQILNLRQLTENSAVRDDCDASIAAIDCILHHLMVM